MAKNITMPKLSQTTEIVELMRWLVQPGDEVKKGDPLCEIESDKTTMEVESFASGTVLKLIGEPETEITAGTVIAIIGEKGEKVEEEQSAGTTPAGSGTPGVTNVAAETAPHKTAGTSKQGGRRGITRKTRDDRGVLATPLVRNLVRKYNVDLAEIQGTGAKGLITKKDVEAYLRSAKPEREEAKKGERKQAAAGSAGVRALSGQQQLVARRLSMSTANIPHYYLKTSVGMDALLEWRDAHPDKEGKKYSMTALLMAACSKALGDYPRFNSWYQDDTLIIHPGRSIGFALSLGDNLYVPIVRDVQDKNIKELNTEVRRLTTKIQTGSISTEDFTDGTFTITNLGMFSVDEFNAIINPPQTAILAFARTKKILAVEEDSNRMSIQRTCTVTGSFDHRVINGAQGAAFMGKIKEIIEQELFV